MKKTVAVFCSARDIGSEYRINAHSAGKLIGELGFDMVYGGGSQGLMGIVAAAAENAGAEVLGFSAYKLLKFETKPRAKGDFFVKDLGERKLIQLELADIILVLPGGHGTLNELYEAATLNYLNMIHNRVIVYDRELNPLLRQINEIMLKRKTISKKQFDGFTYVDTHMELEEALNEE